MRIDATQFLFADGDANQNASDAFGGGARISRCVRVTVEITLIDQLPVPGNQHAADLLEFAGADRRLQVLQRLGGDSAGLEARGRPSVLSGFWSGRRRSLRRQ